MANEQHVKILKNLDSIPMPTPGWWILRFLLSCEPSPRWIDNFNKPSHMWHGLVPFDNYNIDGSIAEISNVKESDIEEAARHMRSYISQANEKGDQP